MAVASINASRLGTNNYSCGIDALLDCLVYAIPKQVINDSLAGNEFTGLLKTYFERRAVNPTDRVYISNLRNDIWEWSAKHEPTFAARDDQACLPDLLRHIQLSCSMFEPSFTCSRCGVHNSHLTQTNLTLVDEHVRLLGSDIEQCVSAMLARTCKTCDAVSEPGYKSLPKILIVYDAFGNTPRAGTRVSEVITASGQAYTLNGTIRWLPGHFTCQVRYDSAWVNLNDLEFTPPKVSPRLANLLGHDDEKSRSLEFKQKLEDRIIVYVYNRVDSDAELPIIAANPVSNSRHNAEGGNKNAQEKNARKNYKDSTPNANFEPDTEAADSNTAVQVPYERLLKFWPNFRKNMHQGYAKLAGRYITRPNPIKKNGRIVAIPEEEFIRLILALNHKDLSAEGISYKEELIAKLLTEEKKDADSYIPAAELLKDKKNKDHRILANARSESMNKFFADAAREVARGGKADLIELLKYYLNDFHMQNGGDAEKEITALDMLEILSSDGNSPHFLSPSDVLFSTENFSDTEMLTILRQKLGPLICSASQMKNFKKKAKEEFFCWMEPQPINSGWRVSPVKLHRTLCFRFPYMPEKQWLRLYGDARVIGKKSNTIISLSVVNDELRVNDRKLQSPKDIFTVAIFHGSDHRLNLELNVGDGRKGPGFLNQFCKEMKEEDHGHEVYLTGDSMFIDAIHGPRKQFGPTTKGGFNLFSDLTEEDKGSYDEKTGRRSTLPHIQERALRSVENQMAVAKNSFLPVLTIRDGEIVMDIDHAITRCTERILTRLVKGILGLPSDCRIPEKGKEMRTQALDHFIHNINLRGVKSGNFSLKLDQNWNLKEEISLNKGDAQAIITTPTGFEGAERYIPVLKNVSPDELWKKDSDAFLAQAFGQEPGSKLTYFQLENEILHRLGKMYEILRQEKQLVPRNIRKKNSHNIEDYSIDWNIKEQRQTYQMHADVFHRLVLMRFGPEALTGYMLKLIDVAPALMSILPAPMMRFAAEGNEHLHYMHQRFYYNHTPRGGGAKFPDTQLMMLEWEYRNLRYHMEKALDDAELRPFAEQFFLEVNVERLRKKRAVRIIERHYIMYCERKDSSTPVNTRDTTKPPETHDVSGKNFFLLGRLPFKQEQMTETIEGLGGIIRTELPSKDENITVAVICKQIELTKNKLSESVITAAQRDWPLVKPEYILDAAQGTAVLISDYCHDKAMLDSRNDSRLIIKITSPESRQFRHDREPKMMTLVKKHERKRKREEREEGDPESQAAKAESRRKKKAYKSPSKLPGKLSVYGYFTQKLSPEIKVRYPNLPFRGRAEVIRQEWGALSAEQRQQVGTEASEQHEEFKRRALDRRARLDELSPAKKARMTTGLKLSRHVLDFKMSD